MENPTHQYAGFGSRFVSFIIDTLVLAIIGGTVGYSLSSGQQTYVQGWPSLAISYFYNILSWLYWDGATIGKKVMGIKVIRVDGSNVTFATGLIRMVSYLVSAFTLFLGFIWILFDCKKQGFHDKIAGTIVVKA